MTRQNIGIGSAANDGNGDTLRTAGTKINANFAEVYALLGGGDSSNLSTQITLENDAVTFEGTSANNFETRLKVTNPTQDNIITLPDSTGTVTLDNTIQTLTNKTLTAPKLNENVALTSTATELNLLDGVTGVIVTEAGTQTLTNKTLTTPTITAPKVGTSINDTSGNEVIKITATGSAVNELTIANGASTTGPTLSATGGGANLNIIMNAKGTGSVNLSKAAFSSTTVSTNAASIVAGTLIIGNKNSGGTLTLSLANGTTVGEYKIFTNKGTEAMEVTPVTFRGSQTKFTLAQFDGCTCIWDGTSWFLVGNQGEVTVA
tara:strand:+ start:38 stop:994 length:957 start_codon:yes stop_codon:yes gene_type:complete